MGLCVFRNSVQYLGVFTYFRQEMPFASLDWTRWLTIVHYLVSVTIQINNISRFRFLTTLEHC